MRICPKTLKQEATQRLDGLLCNYRKILLVYAAVAMGVSLLAALMNLFLNSQVVKTGSLDGMKIKMIWEATATVSELALAFLSPIWTLGLVGVVLGFARGKNAEPKDLIGGFSRFGAGLGMYLLTTLLYILALLATVYIGTALMSFLADADKLTGILSPYLSSIEANPDILYEPAFLQTLPVGEILGCLWLPILITLLILVVFVAFLSYRLRLAKYYLMDGMGAFQAMSKSFASMKGNVFAFLRLDLSYWWYYGLMLLFGSGALVTLVPILLGMPQVSELGAVGMQFLSFIALCALYWWKGAQVETTFALAYENLKIKTR